MCGAASRGFDSKGFGGKDSTLFLFSKEKKSKTKVAAIDFRAANGTTIRNYGQKRLEGIDSKGINTGITIQVADVNKTLASVGMMTDADNTIIFSKGRSIITSDKGGKIADAAIKLANPANTTELQKKNGVYTFDMWLKRQASNYTPPAAEASNYKNIGAVSTFSWLDDEVM